MDTDEGHIKNLTPDQVSILREFWIALVASIQENPNLQVPESPQPNGWFWNDPPPTPTSTPTGKKRLSLGRLSVTGRSSVTGRTSVSNSPASSRPSVIRPGAVSEVEEEEADTPQLKWCKALEKLFLFAAYDHPDVIALRFLRARKWDVKLAVEMLIKCLIWRVKEGVDDLIKTGEVGLADELAVGKGYLHAVDNDGRPACFIHVRLHDKNTADFEKTCKISILTFEYGRLLMPKGCESTALVFDMTGKYCESCLDFSLANMDYNFTKFLLSIFADYYPESLGLVLIVNAPWVFNGCWAIIKQWIDPVVVQKIQFISLDQVPNYIPKENIPEILREEIVNGSELELSGTGYKFEYQAPSEDEIQQLDAIRLDSMKENDAWHDYKDAAMVFLDTTLKWAYVEEDGVEAERTDRVEKLYSAYKRLAPYVRSKSHYHRLGLIDDEKL